MSNKIIAIVGMPGAGKSTLVKYLSEAHGFYTIYFGGLVIEEIKRRGLDVNPDNEKTVREELRSKHGMAAMAIQSVPKIKDGLAIGKTVLIDGLYSYEEFQLLKDKFGDALVTIAIHASRDVRESRLLNRPDRPITAEQLQMRDEAEVKNLNKAPPIVLADYHFVNDGAEDAMTAWGDSLIDRLD